MQVLQIREDDTLVRCKDQGAQTVLHINTNTLMLMLNELAWASGVDRQVGADARKIRAAILEECK